MENWMPIPGYEGLYSVSDLGNVRSEDRVVQHIEKGRLLKGKILKHKINKQTKYPCVILSMNNVKATYPVHVLVCRTFIGPRPSGAEVCHNDGDRGNPKLVNLRYGSSYENREDSRKHGTLARGSKLHRSSLTEDDIRAIRSDNRLQADIAKQYGVGVSAISNIKNRVHWRHVE